jgi:AraC-like DNA-binding protein
VNDLPQYSWKALDPCIVFVNLLPCKPGFSFGPRVIADHQFIYVLRGKGTARIQNRSYEAGSGDLFYYGPDIAHEFHADIDEPFVVYGLHFSLFRSMSPEAAAFPTGIRNAAFSDTSSPESLLILGETPSHRFQMPEQSHPGLWIHDYFARLLDRYQQRDELAVFQSRAILMELLVSLAHRPTPRHGLDSDRSRLMEHLQTLLEKHVESPYSQEWLRQWTSYHENHAARLFRRYTGMSPHDYHIRQKIRFARQLLQETALPVTSIAERLHFSGIHYFSKLFKQLTGVSPTQYRRQRNQI